MLQALLLAGIVAAPLGSAALFLPIRRRVRGAGTWPAVRRFVLAVLGTAVLAAAVAVILREIGVSEHNLVAGVAGVVFASLVFLPVTRRWSARAHMCWAFAHLDHWPGYKSGALNYALRRMTSPEAEVIGVIDSDYQVRDRDVPGVYVPQVGAAVRVADGQRRAVRAERHRVDQRAAGVALSSSPPRL